jgi:type I restriction enzyme M protein
MSSQGDAGQFRTPRHIIDFIVNVVDPKKEDKILDPACGTGGFLVSAYKHILKQHDGKDENGKLNNEKPLTPDDRKKLIQNFEGYDVDPDMVRISQVNMYLHQFKNPKIYNYNTLSQEERWGEKFDVILANPPFMSPKGGVRPHSKFSVKSNRAEVLFVDYIMNHLKLRGRAGIIVPEGIIFQSANSYKKLRKNLVEDGLWAVISLPSGVFNPYSGVKTSILLFDNEIAKKFKFILFAKVNNDGYSLGAQRKEIDDNDLDQIQNTLKSFREYILKGKKDSNFYINYFDKENKELDKKTHSIFIENYTFVKKEKLAENKEYNLMVERYRETMDWNNAKWKMVELGEICEIKRGFAFKSSDYTEKGILNFRVTNIGNDGKPDLSDAKYLPEDFKNKYKDYLLENDDFVIVMVGATTGKMGLITKDILPALLNQNMWRFEPLNLEKINKKYLFYIIGTLQVIKQGGARDYLKQSDFIKIQIPLPPLELQEQIVAEIEQYQKVIDGAKQVAENWKPSFRIDPSWKMVELGEVCDVRDGTHDSPKYQAVGIPLITSKNLKDGTIDFENINYISEEDHIKISKRSGVDDGDVLYAMIGTIGNPIVVKKDREFSIKNVALFKFQENKKLNNYFLKVLLDSKFAEDNLVIKSRGGTQNFVSLTDIRNLKIPLPPLEAQEQIVAEIEAEQKAIDECKKLIEKMEKKIEAKIGEVWGV